MSGYYPTTGGNINGNVEIRPTNTGDINGYLNEGLRVRRAENG
jgi:hypothetical protein